MSQVSTQKKRQSDGLSLFCFLIFCLSPGLHDLSGRTGIEESQLEDQQAVARDGALARGAIGQVTGYIDKPMVANGHMLKGCGVAVDHAAHLLFGGIACLQRVFAIDRTIKDKAFGVGLRRDKASLIDDTYRVGEVGRHRAGTLMAQLLHIDIV